MPSDTRYRICGEKHHTAGVFSHPPVFRFPLLQWLCQSALILLAIGLALPARAQSLTYDVRLGDGGNTKARTVSVGDVLTLQVFAVVTGTDGLNNEGMQFGWGSALSTGSGTSAGGNLSSLTLAGPFNGASSQSGTVQDLNGDGFADVGSTSNSQNTDFIFARSNTLNTTGTRVGADQEEFLLGTMTYTVTAAGDNTTTGINFQKGIFTPVNQRNSLFQVDGQNKNDLNASIGSAAGVLVSSGQAAAYWKGGQSSSWITDNLGSTNWATDVTGTTDAGVLPGTATDVFFYANGATNITTTLDRDFSIKSLNFTASATSSVTVASGGAGNFKLTLGAGGINVAAGSGAHTISANTVLGASQDWTIDTHPAVDFTHSGQITGTSDKVLRKQGSGTLKLTGDNSNFLGTLEVYNGTVNAAATNSLGGVTEVKVMGGSLTLGGGTSTTNRLRDGAKITLFSNTKLVRLGMVSEGSATATGMGQLSLAGNATVDFGNWGTEIGTLAFADFDPTTFTLTVDNWTSPEFAADPQNYTPSSLTDDRLIFGTDQTANLAKFVFVGYTGARQIDLHNGLYEIVPDAVFTAVPEASTVYICLALLGLVAWRQRHSLRAFGRWFANPESKDA
jgi:hypothetical protein